MNTSELVAERRLIFISPEGTEIESSVQIGRPYASDVHMVCCDIEIPNVEKRRRSAGVDSVQAIQEAMFLAATIIDVRVTNGWRLLWPDTREETSAKEIFGRLTF